MNATEWTGLVMWAGSILLILGWLAYAAAKDALDRMPIDPELDACLDRHPAKGDAARLEQALAIRDAEEAWDRDVWGQK